MKSGSTYNPFSILILVLLCGGKLTETQEYPLSNGGPTQRGVPISSPFGPQYEFREFRSRSISISGLRSRAYGNAFISDRRKRMLIRLCPLGYYGRFCSKSCPLRCRRQCDKTGRCVNCTTVGVRLPLCRERCEAGFYGFNCQKMCSKTCFNSLCEPESGDCLQCQAPGVTLPSCKEKCPDFTYGFQCKLRCYSCSLGCEASTGRCLSLADESEYYRKKTHHIILSRLARSAEGIACSPYCQNYCNRQNGHCGACASGYEPPFCRKNCHRGYYGPECNRRCSEFCDGNGCSWKTGQCHGCKEGYRGFHCSEKCPQGWYGKGCSIACAETCTNRSCDHKTGNCIGCEAGYMGRTCERFCAEGMFGPKCKSKCSPQCRELQCDPVTGECVFCLTGYKGNFCNETCPETKFGVLCTQPCPESCLNLTCNNINGKCLKCPDGFQGDFCTDNVTRNDVGGRRKSAHGMIVLMTFGILTAFFVCGINVYGYKKLKSKIGDSITDYTQCQLSSSIFSDDSSDTQLPVKATNESKKRINCQENLSERDKMADLSLARCAASILNPSLQMSPLLLKKPQNVTLCLDFHILPRKFMYPLCEQDIVSSASNVPREYMPVTSFSESSIHGKSLSSVICSSLHSSPSNSDMCASVSEPAICLINDEKSLPHGRKPPSHETTLISFGAPHSSLETPPLFSCAKISVTQDLRQHVPASDVDMTNKSYSPFAVQEIDPSEKDPLLLSQTDGCSLKIQPVHIQCTEFKPESRETGEQWHAQTEDSAASRHAKVDQTAKDYDWSQEITDSHVADSPSQGRGFNQFLGVLVANQLEVETIAGMAESSANVKDNYAYSILSESPCQDSHSSTRPEVEGLCSQHSEHRYAISELPPGSILGARNDRSGGESFASSHKSYADITPRGMSKSARIPGTSSPQADQLNNHRHEMKEKESEKNVSDTFPFEDGKSDAANEKEETFDSIKFRLPNLLQEVCQRQPANDRFKTQTAEPLASTSPTTFQETNAKAANTVTSLVSLPTGIEQPWPQQTLSKNIGARESQTLDFSPSSVFSLPHHSLSQYVLSETRAPSFLVDLSPLIPPRSTNALADEPEVLTSQSSPQVNFHSRDAIFKCKYEAEKNNEESAVHDFQQTNSALEENNDRRVGTPILLHSLMPFSFGSRHSPFPESPACCQKSTHIVRCQTTRQISPCWKSRTSNKTHEHQQNS